MRRETKLVAALLAVMVLALVSAGCSKSSGPSSAPSGASSGVLSDEDATKAIKAWIQESPMTALSAIEILDRGTRKQDGSYSYKVKFTASQFVEYKTRKQFIKEMTFTISKSEDNKGKSQWMAKEEK